MKAPKEVSTPPFAFPLGRANTQPLMQAASRQQLTQGPSLHSFYSLPSTHYSIASPFFLAPLLNPKSDLHPSNALRGASEREKCKGQYGHGVFGPQVEDYCKLCPQYCCLMGSDYMQMAGPSIININNVNANGNALIVNGSCAEHPVVIREEPKGKVGKDGVFEIKVDNDYYKQRYAGNSKLILNC